MIQLRQSDGVMISTWAASASSFLSLPAIFLLPPFHSLSSSLSCFLPRCCLDFQAFASLFFPPRQIWTHSSMTVFKKVEKVGLRLPPPLLLLPPFLSLPSMSVSGYQQLAVVGGV